MHATWIVSANSSRARFFSQEQFSDSLEEINDMVNEPVRLRSVDTESDKMGTTTATNNRQTAAGVAPNKAYEPAQTPDEHQAELFARDIADFLLQAFEENRFRQLSLVVSPHFLGILRKLLDPRLESVVSLEINKDYTQFNPQKLLEQVKAYKNK